MNKICVHLYGNGSRKCRLRAEYLYCDKCNECSTYKTGKCFGISALFGNRCPYVSVNKVDGGTKQSKTYDRVYSTAKSDETYGKLEYPTNTLVTRIGNEALLTLPYCYTKFENEKFTIESPFGFFGASDVLLSEEYLTPENIYKIVSLHPRAFFGNEEITDYQRNTVPYFLKQLKELFTDKYNDFIKKYPEYADKVEKEVNYVGRIAQLNTLDKSRTYTDYNGNVFNFDGDYIVCENYKSAFTPFCAGTYETNIRLKCIDDMRYKIKSNDEVTKDTIFLD